VSKTLNGCIGLVNAHVLTMDRRDTVCEAVLVESSAIRSRGTSQEVRHACLEAGGRVVDLNGATLLPGFHDCHVHMLGTGMNAAGIDMYDCASLDEVLQIVREADRHMPADRWVYGKRLDESRLREGRPPTAAELDAVAPKRPVYIVDRGLHYVLVNTSGFQMLGLTEDTPGVRKDPHGRPTGRLHEQANGMAKRAFAAGQSPSELEDALRLTATMAARAGITTLHAVEGGVVGPDASVPVILDAHDRFPVRVILFWSTEDIDAILRAGLKQQGSDILLDGSIGSRTASFEEPYSDDPSKTGLLYYSDERVEEMITKAHLADVQISFHAIGERAITQALDAFERVLRKHPKADHRHCLEHFGFPKPGEVERTARLGISISTQPAFMYLRGGPDGVYHSRLGAKRERHGYPLRAFLDAGITVGGGSDSDVTPMVPLLGIHAAVNQPYPESNVTVKEALRMYTSEAARTTFGEKVRGSIEEGKAADLVVLAENPLTVPQDRIKDIEVLRTMKGGGVTYEKRA
jgi:predicted amidohydrolase YtcJ